MGGSLEGWLPPRILCGSLQQDSCQAGTKGRWLELKKAPLGCELVIHGGGNTEVRPSSGVGVRKERGYRREGRTRGPGRG